MKVKSKSFQITGIKTDIYLLLILCTIVILFLAHCTTRNIGRLKLDPESFRFYETTNMIMTKEEAKIFSFLPDEASRKEFIREFWEKRDPDPSTPENEFKSEFEARVAYAAKRFNEGGRGWNTDRGRIYIFMGPPDKFEEIFTHDDPSIRGPILIWIYYKYGLGIEFVDEKGTGQYKIRRYEGDFFEAMDLLKLGRYFGPDDVFKKEFVKFKLNYDPKNKEIIVILPAKDIIFHENDNNDIFVELNFRIYIYAQDGKKLATIEEMKAFTTSIKKIDELNEISFKFNFPLPAGKNYIDVLISGSRGKSGLMRRIFEVRGSS